MFSGGCNDLTKCMPLSAGEFLKLLACLSATSIANAISTVVFHGRLFSAQSFLNLSASQATDESVSKGFL